MIYVLDSCAMIAFLRKEPGSEVVREAIIDTESVCYAHGINLCEVYYDFWRAGGEEWAEQAVRDLLLLGVVERNDFHTVFWKQIGFLKANNKVSIADCIAIALTKSLGGTILTSDHHEFDNIVNNNICSVKFIR